MRSERSRDPERLRAAAARLRHDLGKAVRFSAPGARERDHEALRERLRVDLLATRAGLRGNVGAVEVFEAWRREEGALFDAVPEWADRLARIEAAMETVRRLAPRLPELANADLELLDQASVSIQEECRDLYRAISAASERLTPTS